jgi:small subunit ribosomal protein S20
MAERPASYNMPITRSAKKAHKQSLKKRAQNLVKKNKYKTLIKQLGKTVKAGKKDDGTKLLPDVYQALDKAAKTHVIKPNKAARLKSHSAKLVK